MTAPVVVAVLAGWAGLTLLLAHVPWFSRRPLAERLGPYLPGGMVRQGKQGVLSVASFRDAIGPLARLIGSAVERLTGVGDELDRRLRRIHAPLDVTAFRVRQLGWAVGGAAVGVLFGVVVRPPAPILVVVLLAGPGLAVLLVEQQVAAASARWQRTVTLELPVIAEQLGMLLASGFSLVGALDRVAARGAGAVARDLRVVLARVQQGVVEDVALREWAETADVRSVDRLVSVLSLHRDATDLSRLISAEARSIRRDVQRELIETLERRGQQVWIPVTVATLLPGVLFIAIPFRDALSGFLM